MVPLQALYVRSRIKIIVSNLELKSIRGFLKKNFATQNYRNISALNTFEGENLQILSHNWSELNTLEWCISRL